MPNEPVVYNKVLAFRLNLDETECLAENCFLSVVQPNRDESLPYGFPLPFSVPMLFASLTQACAMRASAP